ncbi:MFS transporter [Endothiovibrio diazotrophicus]
MTSDRFPFWRLSSFYFFYFASLGALIPYWGLYLKHQGFSAAEIGQLIGILGVTKIVAPNLWGWIADHSGRSMPIVRLAGLAAAFTFVGVFWGDGSYWWLVGVMVLFSFFWNAALPQFEAVTMNHLGEAVHRYSTVRSWGSVGFIVTVVVLGPLVEDWYDPSLLPWVILALFAGIWLSALAVPERSSPHRHVEHPPIRRLLRHPRVISLLAMAFLVQASHGPYYTFYSIYLTDHGYSGALTGGLWALGVVAEIVVFLLMPRLLPRFGARRLLLATLALTALRWVMIALFVDRPSLIVAAQLLHAFSFGAFHAVTIHLIHQLFVGRNQGRGQALYSSISFGAGGALGSFAAGGLWESAGPEATYLAAAACAVMGWVITWIGVRERG